MPLCMEPCRLELCRLELYDKFWFLLNQPMFEESQHPRTISFILENILIGSSASVFKSELNVFLGSLIPPQKKDNENKQCSG